jgi:hypothetical protein
MPTGGSAAIANSTMIQKIWLVQTNHRRATSSAKANITSRGITQLGRLDEPLAKRMFEL